MKRGGDSGSPPCSRAGERPPLPGPEGWGGRFGTRGRSSSAAAAPPSGCTPGTTSGASSCSGRSERSRSLHTSHLLWAQRWAL